MNKYQEALDDLESAVAGRTTWDNPYPDESHQWAINRLKELIELSDLVMELQDVNSEYRSNLESYLQSKQKREEILAKLDEWGSYAYWM